MKITDEAKLPIFEALVSNNYDCIQVTIQQANPSRWKITPTPLGVASS